MGRHYTHFGPITIVTGSDNICGRFIQVVDNRFAGHTDDPQGEGYVFDHDQLSGATTNLIDLPVRDDFNYSNQEIVEMCNRLINRLEIEPPKVNIREEVKELAKTETIDSIYNIMAGRLGLFGVAFFGHKGTRAEKKRLNYLWNEIIKLKK
jgi:hypothetical protein